MFWFRICGGGNTSDNIDFHQISSLSSVHFLTCVWVTKICFGDGFHHLLCAKGAPCVVPNEAETKCSTRALYIKLKYRHVTVSSPAACATKPKPTF